MINVKEGKQSVNPRKKITFKNSLLIWLQWYHGCRFIMLCSSFCLLLSVWHPIKVLFLWKWLLCVSPLLLTDVFDSIYFIILNELLDLQDRFFLMKQKKVAAKANQTFCGGGKRQIAAERDNSPRPPCLSQLAVGTTCHEPGPSTLVFKARPGLKEVKVPEGFLTLLTLLVKG